MKKRISILLIILMAVSGTLWAKGDEALSGYQLLYSKLNQEQLQSQIKIVNNEILTASIASAGGIALTGLGALSTVVGVILVTSEPIIDFDPDNDLQMMMWPLALSILALQYGGGLALIGSGGVEISTGIGFFITASGNIGIQLKKKQMIQLELKQFQPISYKDNPGVGIGISIPLNNN